MKKFIIALFLVIMVCGIFVPTASAGVVGTINYNVSPTRVNLTEGGTGSFNISVPGSADPYAGVQFVVQLPDGVTISSVDYSLAGVITAPPMSPPGGQAPDLFYFSCRAEENKFTEELICTVSVSYKGTTEKTLTIKEVRQSTINATAQIESDRVEDLVSDHETNVTLVPNNGGVSMSTDATLSALSISSGTLSPVFNPNTTNYTASVANSVSSITVTATPGFAGAKVVGAGTTPLTVGANTITVTVTAEDGVTTKSYTIIVTRADSGSSGSSGSSSTGGSGTIPSGDVPLSPITSTSGFPFTDVNSGDWFYNDVYYAWESGLMNGTAENLFSPNTTLTRGMVVTVLYRHEAEPSVENLNNPFPDVAAGQWYFNAVKWAADKKIILGYSNGNFGPNDDVTREQLAAILYRYADFTEEDLPGKRAYPGFMDDGSISEYAKEAVAALYMAEVINGKPNNLFDPKGNATRAEFAAMIHRFLEM